MLEREIERLLTIGRQQTIGKGEAISVKEILAAEIPYPLKVFFRADVDRMLSDELRRWHESSRFTHHHREVESLQRQMNSTLVLNFSFLREEFLQKMEDGVHLLVNYLLRPQWTLTNFLFNTKASIAVSDLKTMLAYFGAYEYLKAVLFRYVDEKKLETLTMNEFQHLAWRIDAEYLKRKGGIEIARLTTPVYDFIHFTPVSTSASTIDRTLPTKALMKFFEDKRLRIICESLEKSGQGELSMEQLQALLDETYRSNTDAFTPEEAFLPRQTPLEGGRSPEPVAELQPQAPALPPVDLIELQQLISNDDQRRFIKKIFRKDESYYAASLNALNALSSWKEASVYIDKILIANDVDPYSNEAVRFSEVVHERFFPRMPRR
jgi:hypothetical protein